MVRNSAAVNSSKARRALPTTSPVQPFKERIRVRRSPMRVLGISQTSVQAISQTSVLRISPRRDQLLSLPRGQLRNLLQSLLHGLLRSLRQNPPQDLQHDQPRNLWQNPPQDLPHGPRRNPPQNLRHDLPGNQPIEIVSQEPDALHFARRDFCGCVLRGKLDCCVEKNAGSSRHFSFTANIFYLWMQSLMSMLHFAGEFLTHLPLVQRWP